MAQGDFWSPKFWNPPGRFFRVLALIAGVSVWKGGGYGSAS